MSDNDKQDEIEVAFIQSWDAMNGFYQRTIARDIIESGREYIKKVLILIPEFRRHGYDKKTRAGSSLMTFILSRANKDGLQHRQPHIRVGFSGDRLRLTLWDFGNDEEQFEFNSTEITDEVRVVLDRLVAQPIN